MELLTQEIKNALPPLYSTESDRLSDKVFICKFFNPVGAGTWYVCEGAPVNPTMPDDDWLFFGMVDIGMGKEWGYFHLSELKGLTLPLGLGIERDIHFKNEPAAKYEDYPFSETAGHEPM